jgi:hypothetical protein
MANPNSIGEISRRLKAVEHRLASTPSWRRGTPEYSRLTNDARRLKGELARLRLRQRFVVPDTPGPLARYRISIPRKKEGT